MLDFGRGRRKQAIWNVDAASRPLHHFVAREMSQLRMVIRNGSPPHKFGGMAGREGQKDFEEGRRRRNGIWKIGKEEGWMRVGMRKEEVGKGFWRDGSRS
jgi:hypothetical protein